MLLYWVSCPYPTAKPERAGMGPPKFDRLISAKETTPFPSVWKGGIPSCHDGPEKLRSVANVTSQLGVCYYSRTTRQPISNRSSQPTLLGAVPLVARMPQSLLSKT